MTETTAAKPRWFQTWWGVAILTIAGAVLPQLCGVIPNALGSRLCTITVSAAVVAFQPSPLPVLPPSPAAPPPAEVCPESRRLSTGKCVPP